MPLRNPKVFLQKNSDKIKEERKNEINDYVEKCQATHSDLITWRQNKSQAIKHIFE